MPLANPLKTASFDRIFKIGLVVIILASFLVTLFFSQTDECSLLQSDSKCVQNNGHVKHNHESRGLGASLLVRPSTCRCLMCCQL